MRILAVYGSAFGQAESVLRRVAGVLERSGHEVSVFKGDDLPGNLVVEGFDAVLVAGSIINGRYQRYLRAFVRRHRAALTGRPTAFISVNGSSPESVPEWRQAATKYVESFLRTTRWSPRWTVTFAGALRYPRYGPVTRWIMKKISARHGGPTDTSREYEFTDWDAVDRFATAVAEALPVEQTVGA